MKFIFRSLILLLFIIIFFLSYLSIVGFETKRFNDQIIKEVKNINENLEIELKEIKIILDPFRLKLNAKIVGSKLKNKNKVLEIEKINTQISLKSLLNENSIIENLEISTKSLKIKDLISFIRVINNNAELYLLEKVVKKGFLIADVKLYFDKDGNIKNNYEISGFVKDTRIKILKNYRLNKLNLNFSYKKNVLDFKNISVSLNNLNFVSKNLNFKNIKDEFIIKGEIGNKSIVLDNKNIELFIKPHFPDLDIDKIIFSSKNKFSFKVNKKFQFNDLDLKSEIEINEFLLLNDFQLKKIFPKIKKNIKFSNHKLKMNLEKKILMVNGMGNILLQNNNDKLTYSINKKGKILNFKTSLRVKDNPLIIDFLNYKKEENNEILINLNGSKELKNKTKIDLISLKENNNKFIIEGLELDKEFKITDLKTANISYKDRENVKNKFNIINKKDNFYVAGSIFNANKLVESLINDDEDELDIINKNFKLIIKIDKLFLDPENSLSNFEGNLSLNNQKIINGNLYGNFANNKKFKFTVKTDGDEKITTFFLDKAEAIVKRYKFIKGFNGGILDFYSSKKGDVSTSTLKIYDFKLKELSVLTKILTLASLQGIADILTGEGIRFNEFEMNFRNNANIMTIDEIYAIGPAISILMNGYVEKNKLVSLRGTLVPATTINKVIGSIPILGQILVGSKTGEGVFGVSFKIKGPPKNLETNVNPIKTLTPRFITRTLEKIKKN